MATLLTVILPTAEIAQKIARDLRSKVVAEAGWHVYNNMEHLLEQRMATSPSCSFSCPNYQQRGGQMNYRKGMLPQTDDLLGRSLNLSVGVSDPGLGSAFGVTINDGPEVVEERAAEFRRVVRQYLS